MDQNQMLAKIADLEKQLEFQKLLADNAFEAIGVFDDDLRCVAANREITEVLGYTTPEVMGMRILDFIAKDYHATAAENVGRETTEPYFLHGVRKDGTIFPAEARGKTVFRNGKKYRVASLRDISFRESTKDDLQASLREMEIIFSSTRIGLMYLKGGRHIRKVNMTMAEMFGYDSPDEMAGMSVRELHISEENFIEFGEQYFATLANGAQLNIEYQLKSKNGQPFWCSLSGQAVDTKRPVDLNKGVLWVIDDISARKAEEQRLVKLATTDDLTGALTRSEFFRLAENILTNEKRALAGPSLLMIDLDHFKVINDTYGHEAGDMVLTAFARECRSILRDGDLFARLGGEEFAVLLPTADLGGAIIVAERLRKRIAQSKVTTPEGNINYTISIGASGTGSTTIDIEELLRRADKSLYSAKTDGRNRVSFYD